MDFKSLFETEQYLKTYPDLNFKRKNQAWNHFQSYGWKENRYVAFKDREVFNKYHMMRKSELILKEKKKNTDFKINDDLKEYTITLLGYKKVQKNGTRHTNWFPWNRFYDVFHTIGYNCEWVSLENLARNIKKKKNRKKRLFITWNEPTSLELYQSGIVGNDDIIFQKLTSLGKGMDNVNWTSNPRKWCEEWHWPIYRTVEYLYDLGLNIYGFGCRTDINLFSEKERICKKLKERIFWISWGGTPFSWEQIKNCKPNIKNLKEDISFIGSKWGKNGRGNMDSWRKYIEPFEKCKYKFNQYGGIGNKMVRDDEMTQILQRTKLCPIIHAPIWQAERGVQDRFYTVFLCGRFGICDNLGAVDIFGDEIKEICTEDPKEYNEKSIYYLEHPEEQLKYIQFIQNKIKEKYNFYRQWENILNNINLTDKLNNNNIDLITCINYGFLPKKKEKIIPYNNQNINSFFDKIFIVNMRRDKKKKIKMLEYLDFFNITNFEFIEAYDGKKLNQNNEYKQLLNKPLNKISNFGELGCLLSHKSILEIAKKRGYKKWLHLEDDVIFNKDFNQIFSKNMKCVPKCWDILYLGSTQAYWRENNVENVNNSIYKANISCGTFAFAVSNTNIDFILNRFKMLCYPSDSIITQEIQNILNCYVFKNNLIVARLNTSTLRSNNIKERDLFKKYKWYYSKYIINIQNHKINNEMIKNEYNKVCNAFTNINEFKNFVENKKIAIIGPSPSVKDTRNGDFIEKNYDIIIRINKQWKFDKNLYEFIGKRTDILYNCMDYREDCGGEIDIEYIKDKTSFVVSTIKYDYNNKTHRDSQFHGKSFLDWYYHFHKKNNNLVKFIPIPGDFYDKLDKVANTRINAGLMAILHILSFNIKELYIKGFSFFLDGYLLDYRGTINGKKCTNEYETKKEVVDFLVKKNNNHNQEKQWRLFKNIYNKKKDIITLDNKLKKIVNLNKFPSFD